MRRQVRRGVLAAVVLLVLGVSAPAGQSRGGGQIVTCTAAASLVGWQGGTVERLVRGMVLAALDGDAQGVRRVRDQLVDVEFGALVYLVELHQEACQ